MPWSSQYQATFTKPLIRQLLAILQRDQRAALDFVGGVNVLPSIVSYQLAPLTIPQFPAVLMAPVQQPFDRETQVGSRKYEARIYCAVAVAHQDAQVLSELVQDYVAAIDAVFSTVPLSDFALALPLELPHLGNINTTAGLQPGSVKDLWIEDHVYDEIRRVKTQFAVTATMPMIVDREEA